MLNENNYKKGLIIHEQTKYNINYDRQPLFDIICSSLAQRLLDDPFSADLTAEQKEVLNNLINK